MTGVPTYLKDHTAYTVYMGWPKKRKRVSVYTFIAHVFETFQSIFARFPS